MTRGLSLGLLRVLAFAGAMVFSIAAHAQYDPDLANRLGADEFGMRAYVLVVLKTGPRAMPAGPQRDEMFRGHFANMARLARENKLVLAGPLDGVDGWRGLFVFATDDLDEARRLVATDPVIVNGEVIAEMHKLYGSAAMMQLNEVQRRIELKKPS